MNMNIYLYKWYKTYTPKKSDTKYVLKQRLYFVHVIYYMRYSRKNVTTYSMSDVIEQNI